MRFYIHGIFQAQNDAGEWRDIISGYRYQQDATLFAWLAGVRGYNAGDVVPLSAPRGLPEAFLLDDDGRHPIEANAFRGPCADEVQVFDSNPNYSLCLLLDMGTASHSWLSAEEILENSLQAVTRRRTISRADFHIFGGGNGTLTVEIDGGYFTADPPKPDHEDIAPGTFCIEMGKKAHYFVSEVRRLQALHGKVRFVFGFSS